jgi:hypothetical protein
MLSSATLTQPLIQLKLVGSNGGMGMSWLEKLTAKTQDFQFSVAGTKPAAAQLPRDLVLQAIDDSIAFLKDPKFRVSSGRRKGKEPDLVYRLDGEQAAISLRYYRVRLTLHGNNDELSLDKTHLSDALQALREGVADGEFDAQLDKIRSARLNKPKSKKPK